MFKTKVVAVITAALIAMTAFFPISTCASTNKNANIQVSKNSEVAKSNQIRNKTMKKLISSKKTLNLDIHNESKTSSMLTKSIETNNAVAVIDSNAILLDSSGQESGKITTAGSNVEYYTIATQNSDYGAYLSFANNPQNCILELDVVDASNGNVIRSSTSNFMNSYYQQTRVHSNAGNIIYFKIIHIGDNVPSIDYTLNVSNISNVTDSNEPNDNILDTVSDAFPAQSVGTTIQANFDNPYDTDVYKINARLGMGFQINFSSSTGAVSDIGVNVYRYDSSTGQFIIVATGTGGIASFEIHYETPYYVQVFSNDGAIFDYSMTTKSLNVFSNTIPYSTSKAGFAVLDLNRTPSSNLNIYDTYTKSPIDEYATDAGYIDNQVSTIPTEILNGVDSQSNGFESYLRNLNDIQVYQDYINPSGYITTAVDDTTAGIAIYGSDGTLIYSNADLSSHARLSKPQVDNDILESVNSGNVSSKTYYQFKMQSSISRNYKIYIYIFPKLISKQTKPYSMPSYYEIWTGAPVYALTHNWISTNTTFPLIYPAATTPVATEDITQDKNLYNLPKHAYFDTIRFLEDPKYVGMVSSVDFDYNPSTQEFWYKTTASNNFTGIFNYLEKVPLQTSISFRYSVAWSPYTSKGTMYVFGFFAHIDYVYELGTCDTPYVPKDDPKY